MWCVKETQVRNSLTVKDTYNCAVRSAVPATCVCDIHLHICMLANVDTGTCKMANHQNGVQSTMMHIVASHRTLTKVLCKPLDGGNASNFHND